MDYLKDEKIRKGADYLLEKGAKEVYLFGSHLKGDNTEASDIDFGVKGFPNNGFFGAIVDLEAITKKRIDLVDFDFDADFFNHLVKTNSIVKLGAV